jgi:3-hydroxypropanoate dehydrogenase
VADTLNRLALEQLFESARSFSEWTDRGMSREDIHRLHELLKWGPTSGNSCPARFVWVVSGEGKEKLAACASDANKAKIRTAPVTVIVGYDLDFAEKLPYLFPLRGEAMKSQFKEPSLRDVTAFRNGTLQGAYLILAARALGWDCGAMSGFDNAAVDREFFAGTNVRSNFLCAIGQGRPSSPPPRNPRLSFEQTSRFA